MQKWYSTFGNHDIVINGTNLRLPRSHTPCAMHACGMWFTPQLRAAHVHETNAISMPLRFPGFVTHTIMQTLLIPEGQRNAHQLLLISICACR